MRKRKRPDTLQRVYKFRTYPIEIPQTMWDTARAMQALWNALVIERETFAEYANEDGGNKKERWGEFDGVIRYLLERSGLNWEAGPAVVDRFITACRSAVRGERDWPHVHRGLKRIMIPHRFTGGGIAIHKLFSQRAERIRIESPPEAAYLDNSQRNRYRRVVGLRFGLGEESINGKIRLHRLLPADGIVKQVAWCGERVGRQWEWHVTITVEEYPVQRALTGRVCGIDVGWRVKEDGSIRVAMIVDSEGNEYEVLVSLLQDNAHARRHEHMNFNGWPDLADWDKRLAATDRGSAERRRIASIRHSLYRRLTRRRDAIYENVAAWLATSYDSIAIEGDLGVKQMAEESDKDYALDAADRYRQIVAPATLLATIRNAARWRGSQIVEGIAAYTTLTCWICAAELSAQDGSLILRCPRGHFWDQDVNAARNLLSQIAPVSGRESGLRQSAPSIPSQLIDIVVPHKAVAAVVHSE